MLIRSFVFVALLSLPQATVAKVKDISSKEKLICEVVLCVPLGLAISASRNKCRRSVLKWSAYVATLGFLKKPPQCPILNSKGEKVGKAKKSGQVCNHSDNPAACKALLKKKDVDYTEDEVCLMLPTKRERDFCLENMNKNKTPGK